MPRSLASLSGYRTGRWGAGDSCILFPVLCSDEARHLQLIPLSGYRPPRKIQDPGEEKRAAIFFSAVISDPFPYYFFPTFYIFLNNAELDLFYICNGNGIPSTLKSHAVLPSRCWKPERSWVGSQAGLLTHCILGISQAGLCQALGP